MERCDRCGVEYSRRMCTCAMHCAECCEPACCGHGVRCDCWCHHQGGELHNFYVENYGRASDRHRREPRWDRVPEIPGDSGGEGGAFTSQRPPRAVDRQDQPGRPSA